jgi:hypothetical protein
MSKANGNAEKSGYSGRTPVKAIIALEWELSCLEHGTASLVIHVRDGKAVRFTTSREASHLLETCDGE